MIKKIVWIVIPCSLIALLASCSGYNVLDPLDFDGLGPYSDCINADDDVEMYHTSNARVISLCTAALNNNLTRQYHYAVFEQIYERRANAYFRQGQYQAALADYDEAIRLAPNDIYNPGTVNYIYEKRARVVKAMGGQ